LEVADAWKHRLFQSTRTEAVYLDGALREWAQNHNRHPDLSTRIELYPAEGVGTTLLTGTQTAALRARGPDRNAPPYASSERSSWAARVKREHRD
jgi:hypothetical protein